MFGALRSLVGGATTPQAVISMPSALPADLVVAIDAAEVFWRPSRADDEEAGPIVRVVGLGRWVFSDLSETADRVVRAYPELPSHLCSRAAKLILAQIARRNRESAGRRPRCWDPLWREYQYFGGFFGG